MTARIYDVALSFAGEDRAYVRDVADTLIAHGISVFYDQYETVEIWGNDLVEFLDDVYRNRSRYAVVFLSEHYARRVWTLYEKRTLVARGLEKPGAYLLPVRLDDTDIPGLPPALAAVDGRLHSSAEVAKLILGKLGTPVVPPAAAAEPPLPSVPLTVADKLRVVTTRPPAWEYLLLAGVIWQAAAQRDSKRLDHEMRYAATSGRHVPDPAMREFAQVSLDELASITARLEGLFGSDRLEWATGRPGEPGDVTRIDHLGHRFGQGYEELLDWAARIRGTAASPRFRHLLELLARLGDQPVRATQQFANDMVTAGGQVAAHAAAQTTDDLVLDVSVDYTLDPDALAAFHSEWNRLFRSIGG